MFNEIKYLFIELTIFVEGSSFGNRGSQFSLESRHSDSVLFSGSSFDVAERRQDDYNDYYEDEDYEYYDDADLDYLTPERRRDEKTAATNTVAVLDMISSLQHEIKEINKEIEKENQKIEQLKSKKKHPEVDDEPVRKASAVSTEETVKELTLQKEDTTMKKVMAQMLLMKKIQNKKEENKQLEDALMKLSERRKLINSALKKQKQIADEKREDARQELERQKNIMREKEKLILRMKAEEDARDIPEEETDEDDEIVKKKNEKIRKLVVLSQLLKQGSTGKLGKLKLTEAHKSLVDASNERILAKIEELKLEKQRESLFEQEQLLDDQRQALAAIKKLKSQRLR